MSKPENAGPMEKGLRLLPDSIEDLDYTALD
jgi:hypothetical protein